MDNTSDPTKLVSNSTSPVSAENSSTQAVSKKILVVEDEADAREIFTDLLSTAGYTVAAAADGNEALARLEAEKDFGLVLLDIIMPNKDGVETLEDIIAKPEQYGKPYVLMLTNIGGDAAVEKAMELGALGYLLKSETEPTQLLETVEKALAGEMKRPSHTASPSTPMTIVPAGEEEAHELSEETPASELAA